MYSVENIAIRLIKACSGLTVCYEEQVHANVSNLNDTKAVNIQCRMGPVKIGRFESNGVD